MAERQWDRRTVLETLGVGACASLASVISATPVRGSNENDPTTVVDFDDTGEQPENIAIDPRGSIYLTMGLSGKVRKLPARKATETGLDADDTEVVTTLNVGDGFLTGITADGPRTLYAALASIPPSDSDQADTKGVYEIDTTDETATLLTDLPVSGLPNGILPARRIRGRQDGLLVSDSFAGVVRRVGFDGSKSVFVDDDLLDPKPADKDGFIGTNGLAVDRHGDLFTVNLDRGTVVRIPVNPDGSAGDPEEFVASTDELVGADGIVFDNRDDLYVAVNQEPFKIARVPERGVVETFDESDALNTPSDVAFGKTTRGTPKQLFVTNFPFGDESTDGKLLKFSTDVTGDVE